LDKVEDKEYEHKKAIEKVHRK